MSSVAVVLLLVGVVAGLCPEKEWPKFVSYYSKTYATEQEYTERFRIFSENLEYIDKFNYQAEQDQKPFCLDIDQYTDLTGDEFHQLSPYEQSLPDLEPAPSVEQSDRPVEKQSVCCGKGFFKNFRWLRFGRKQDRATR